MPLLTKKHEVINESDYKESDENVELKGSGWV